MERADKVAEGRAAWSRLKRVGTTSWEDWLLVAHALEVGRDHAMKVAQTNRPFGKKYTAAMRLWIDQNEFADLTQQERQSCHRVIANLNAIEKWRNSLGAERRRKINHVDSAFWGWKQAASPRKPRHAGVKPQRVVGRGYAPVYWNGDAIRRAADAMRECRSNDLFRLARVAVEAAIRNEGDLLELLTPTRRQHTKSTSTASTNAQHQAA